MKERFDNPPLVELVAELRWKDLSVPAGVPPGFPAGFAFPPINDAFDKQLPVVTNAMTSIGYGASERLVPVGFPVPTEVPIVRYRYSGNDCAEPGREHLPSTLFQIGTGIFTANAVKPYKSWDDFSPIVEKGIKILLDSQTASIEGYSLVLRYIDAFRNDLTGDTTHLQFLKDVFGFKIEAPDFLRNHSISGEVALPILQITVPLKFGKLQLQMAEGEIEGASGYILENVIVIDGLIGPSVEEIMANFSMARDVIHDVFVNLTKPLKEKMKPVEVLQ
ncbi:MULTISPECIES: TIGR04255 family protein [unclassified Pseudomonas]|uniref:TIGR04255 family protein n=1 Tax=unclassified Pseudomonas TaxID=196821 RepID=UPI000C86D32A|nr:MULTISPECIES: TIGR04255 family protein [unclassified Pseudomonas]PMV81448.1 hypothetical protein C1X56_29390 [Pseudomonas sp. GW101-1A09]PMV85690.1 hypothetical protein C1X51_29945 [Pseudomonas sp. FW306-2-2C-B10A]PMW01623.1 hypothetical protein C1X55_05220 [Pseudomonas sp. GW460-C8]PMW03719.1 hypothetical protein C1X50_21400 [Pseudomonas sp. MPR-TSA4]PMW11149.1 hypothetical protein C1X52_21865 [Pseudomonas sp. FW306-2-1A-C05A]